MIRLTFLPAALSALDEIYAYSAENWGQEQADLYVGGLFDFCEALIDRPYRAIPKAFEISGFVSSYRKHRIYWRNKADQEIVVVCILHERIHQFKHLRNLFEETGRNPPPK